MKNITGKARQLGLLVVATILISLPGFARSDQADDEPSIQVTGEGTAQLAPDIATLQLTVRREAKTAREALAANTASMTDVLAAMKREGIAERDLQTANFSIQPRYVYPPNQPQAAARALRA